MSAMAFREPNQARWVGSRPAHKGTQIAKHGVATNATTIIHTVTSGKTLFLCSSILTINTSTAGKFCQYKVQDVGNSLVYLFTSCVFDIVGQLIIPFNFDPPLEIPTGYDLVLISNDINLNSMAFIHGWEE